MVADLHRRDLQVVVRIVTFPSLAEASGTPCAAYARSLELVTSAVLDASSPMVPLSTSRFNFSIPDSMVSKRISPLEPLIRLPVETWFPVIVNESLPPPELSCRDFKSLRKASTVET